MTSSDKDRLSRIETMWSVVRQAHAGSTDSARTAQQTLLDRYERAVRKYLLGAVRDQESADELFQEFALRFVRGDFQAADPERGKFRYFVKTSLYHLIVDQQRRRAKQGREQPLPEQSQGPQVQDGIDLDAEFIESWRNDIFERCWTQLAAVERESRKPYFAALRYRVDHPQATSADLAEHLSGAGGEPVQVGAARVLLHRARKMFSDNIVEEVIQSLDAPSRQELEDELIELNLLDYCRAAVQRRFGAGGA